MATATQTRIPIELVGMAFVDDVEGAIMRREEYRAMIARRSLTSEATVFAQEVGEGWWTYQQWEGDSPYWAGLTLTTGAADHHYLLHPTGTVQALTVIRTSSTGTAADQSDFTFTDSAANFTSGTAVAVGDFVAFANGGTAEVKAVLTATTLTLGPLTLGLPLAAGVAYVIGRTPGTDTALRHTLTGRWVAWDGFIDDVLTRLRLLASRQPGVTIGDLGITFEDKYRRLLQERRIREGVRSA